MTASNDDNLISSHSLLSIYTNNLSTLTTLLEHAEPARLLRVENLLKSHDVDDLQSRLVEIERVIDRVETVKKEVENQFRDAERELGDVREKYENEKRKGDELKSELSSLKSSTSSFSANLLDENVSLRQRLSTLQAELDAANLALGDLRDREVNVARENELQLQGVIAELRKSVAEEKQTREQGEKEMEGRIREVEKSSDAALSELRMKLAQEREEKESVEKELNRFRKDWEEEKRGMEREMEGLRENLQGSAVAATATATASSSSTVKQGEKRRRKPMIRGTGKTGEGDSTPERDDEYGDEGMMTIATPGVPAGKKWSGGHDKVSRPGEKSMFSMTPYLNKTVLMDDEEEVEGVEWNEGERLMGKRAKSGGEKDAEEVVINQEKARPPGTKKRAGSGTAAKGKKKSKKKKGEKKTGGGDDDDDDDDNDGVGLASTSSIANTATIPKLGTMAPPLYPSQSSSEGIVRKKQRILSQNRSILEDDGEEEDMRMMNKKKRMLVGGEKGDRTGIFGGFSMISPRKRR